MFSLVSSHFRRVWHFEEKKSDFSNHRNIQIFQIFHKANKINQSFIFTFTNLKVFIEKPVCARKTFKPFIYFIYKQLNAPKKALRSSQGTGLYNDGLYLIQLNHKTKPPQFPCTLLQRD